MRTRSLVAALLAGSAVAAALLATAGALVTVTSPDTTTILVRGDAGPSNLSFTTSSVAPGGRLTIGDRQTFDAVVVGAPNVAGCTGVVGQGYFVTCDGVAGKTIDVDLGGGTATPVFAVTAIDAPGARVVYHGTADEDRVFGTESTVPLTITLGAGPVPQRAEGGSGPDTISSGASDDLINAGGGDDVVDAGDGNDTVTGGAGVDGLQGGGGNDALDGGDDGDTVDGGSGDDTVTGGKADDVLRGDAGDDTFPSVDGDGADTIDGGEGTLDVASYAARTVPLSLSLNGGADDGAAGEGDNLLGVETVLGGTKDDTLTGDAFANFLTGNAGNDTIDGGEGSDFLRGNAGDDTIIGRDTGLFRDDVACGVGADTAIADFTDSVASDCETVDRAPAPVPPAAPVVPLVPVVPVTPTPAAPVPDTRAPVVNLTGVPAGGRVTRASLRKGLTLRIGTDEAARLDVRIVRSVARAAAVAVAPKDNLTLARVTKPKATGTRTVKLVPAAALLGRGRKTLKLVVVATDAAGNATTITRMLRLR
jgi:Ca2+-binding RTX toxin-like protein